MRILYLNAAGELELLNSLPTGWRLEALQRTELLWVDINQAESIEVVEQFLSEQFGFHPLAIDDALHETHMPKVDDWDSYLYLVLQDLLYERHKNHIALPELDVFLGKQYLVTYHLEQISAVDHVWQQCQRNGRWLQHGADHLLYHLIDEVVNNYTAVLEQLESQILQMENHILTNPTAALLEELAVFKRIVLQIRRILAPQREMVSKLARDPYFVIGEKDQVYFRDVHDHMVRLYNQSDSVRDLLMGSMELYLSMVNNRMNNIMKTLTIITTLFMPLTFITGFFGMNFFQAVFPSSIWTGPTMLLLTLLGLIVLPLIMFYWMRHHDWM